MKDFLKRMLSSDGEISSKRTVTLLAFILVIAGFISNLYWDFTVEEFMFSSVMYIVIAGLGITGAEKFAPKDKNDR